MAKGEKAKKGMDAVIDKVSKGAEAKRKPVLQRKGAGKGPKIAIMIAVGKPKPDMDAPSAPAVKGDDKQVAAIKAQIAELEAKLAALGADDDESEDDED